MACGGGLGVSPGYSRFVEAFRRASSADHPHVYQDRNGRGQTYCTLKYYEQPDPVGPPVQRSLYLGQLDDWAVQRIRVVAAGNAAEMAARKARAKLRKLPLARIAVIRQLLDEVSHVAGEAACGSGFMFKGYDLRRRRS